MAVDSEIFSDAARPIISVQKLSHRYSKSWAIRDVSFDIKRTGTVGLLGSNGAGKSTTMNIICGVLFATQGDVVIDGCSIRDDPLAAKKRLGFLPQQAPLYPDLTVDEYLTYCANLRRVEKKHISAAIDEAKEQCGIAHFSKRLIGALSGGYRQRCGIAQAILHKPSVVVLDEPTNGLDPMQILAVRKLIKQISAERIVVLSTHILPEVEVLCDDIKMIEQGRIVFEGTLEDFTGVVQPQSLISVFGNPPMPALLETFSGIEAVELIAKHKMRVRFQSGTNVASKLVASSVENGWDLKEIHFERSSLESVFARLAESKAT